MIEVAQDQLADTPVQTSIAPASPAAPAVIPDSAKTEEVVEQHANFEVHTPVAPQTGSLGVDFSAPRPPSETAPSLPEAYAENAVNLLQAPSDAVQVEVANDALPEADTSNEVPVGTIDLTAEDTPADGPTEERVVTDKGVDLTALLHFKEQRSANSHKSNKSKRPAAQGGKPHQPQAKAAPARPALLRSEKSQGYLREAMANRVADVDGQNHINTSSMAATQLGKALDMNANIPFHHPELGPFKSVGGLWYFIGGTVQDEAFRTLYGRACRAKGQKVQMRDVRGFKTIIAEATWMKVCADEKLARAMAENKLPYRCYYTVGELNLPQSTAIAEWYMPILEEIGRTMHAIHIDGQADAFPNFDFLEQKPARRPQQRRDNRR